MAEIRLSRVYDHESSHRGKTFLVERLWPRGIRRDDIHLDAWCKDVAPSTELRKWFSHDMEKWPEFRRRYKAELDAHTRGSRSSTRLRTGTSPCSTARATVSTTMRSCCVTICPPMHVDPDKTRSREAWTGPAGRFTD